MSRWCKWFIEIRNAATNKTIGSRLPADSAQENIRCADGKERNLWECDYAVAAEFYRNRNEQPFEFRIWERPRGGRARLSPHFLFRKKRKKMHVVRAKVRI
ncbi:hypothetical protein KW783_01905 [Candidatus Parcubacteria bacterium]|nr:hypothetical protein [Candidatus Parcubacteria bacterium]